MPPPATPSSSTIAIAGSTIKTWLYIVDKVHGRKNQSQYLLIISLHIAVLLMLEGNNYSHLKTGNPSTGHMANSEDPDEMQLLLKIQMKCHINSGSALFSKTN